MRYICFVLFLVSTTAAAQQSKFEDYDKVREVFWPILYSVGGETLYCGIKFEPKQKKVGGRKLTIEHVYSADWIAEHHGCKNRSECDNDAYGYAEADLHNLWPAIGDINSSRQDKSLGEIPGEEQRRFVEYCPDYERTRGSDAIVEPRDAVKGDIARSLLYMLDAYSLKLPSDMELDMLLKWHLADPPDDNERWRNLAIERLQGTRNPYIQ